MDGIAPFQKIRNAEHDAAYAFARDVRRVIGVARGRPTFMERGSSISIPKQ